jgi:CRP/FNR family transcriptional regulator, cyclic AMP receptor protein
MMQKRLAAFFEINGSVFKADKGRLLAYTDLGDNVYWIRTGLIIAGVSGLRRPTHAFGIFEPGYILQARFLIEDRRTDITYKPITAVTMYGVSVNNMLEAINRDSLLSMDIARLSLTRTDLLSKRIENLNYRYASDKLIYRILHLAERFGIPEGNGIYIPLQLTHRELGTFINMARESVSREMQKLIDKGLITYNQRHITILHPRRLIESMHETIRTDWSNINSLELYNLESVKSDSNHQHIIASNS